MRVFFNFGRQLKKTMLSFNIKLLAPAILLSTLLTGCHSTVKDIDGNKYKIVTIGNQVWMKENLKTTRFNDGTPIPMVSDNDLWKSLTTPGFCWYNNDSTANKNVYGGLYNWFTVSTGKLCPAGWHVPSDQDWMNLTANMQGIDTTGGKLKEAGLEHWKHPNTSATNISGFTALPAGYRSFEGIFNLLGASGYWWTSTRYNDDNVMFWNLRYKFGSIYKYRSEKFCGFSVRCIKDSI
jgi:uncharacterized protein (TIGR02145 family)